MIRQEVKEYSEDGLAVRTLQIKFLGMPIFKYKKTSTNKMAVAQLTPSTKPIKVKGFSNETKNKSKKTKCRNALS